MSETPRKLVKTRARNAKKDKTNKECRLCKINLKAESRRKENLLSRIHLSHQAGKTVRI